MFRVYKPIVYTHNAQANVYRFVLPAPQYAQQHTELIRICLGDADIETLEGVKTKRPAFQSNGDDSSAISRFCAMFNGNWNAKTWEHYCCKTPTAGGGRIACCSSPEKARTKMRASWGELSSAVLFDRLGDSTKAWCETPRVAGPMSLLTAVHSSLPQAVLQGWAGAAAEAGDSGSEEVRRDDDPRIKTLKRQKRVVGFFQSGCSHDELLRGSITFRPIRRLLSEFFKTEHEATVASAGAEAVDALKEVRSASGMVCDAANTLLGRIVCEGGRVLDTKREIELLFDDRVSALARVDLFIGRDVLAENRAALLKCCSSFEHRLKDPLLDPGSFFQCTRLNEAEAGPAQEQLGDQLAETFRKCERCCDLFTRRALRRTRGRWKPLVQSRAFRRGVRWLGNTSPVVTIVNCELSHAAFSNKLRGRLFFVSKACYISIGSVYQIRDAHIRMYSCVSNPRCS